MTLPTEAKGQEKLASERLYRRTDLTPHGFATTETLEPASGVDVQLRAQEALDFGIGMHREGYNLFVMGPEGAGKFTAVRKLIEARASQEPVPSDWVYVFNFDVPFAPKALKLPPGQGRRLKAYVQQLVEDLKSALYAAFDAADYRGKRRSLDDELSAKRDELVKEVDARAKERGAAVLTTDDGLLVAPFNGDKPFEPDEFEALPLDVQSKMLEALEPVRQDLQSTLEQLPRFESEIRKRVRALDHDVCESAVRPFFEDLQVAWKSQPHVLQYFEAMRLDVIDNARRFLPHEEEDGKESPQEDEAQLAPYQINVLVDQSERKGAPVVFEDNPTYANLVGRMDHAPDSTGPASDFQLIKAGALHRANGGYLVLQVQKLMQDAHVWDALKRMLRSREIRLESPERQVTLQSMVSLEPEVIPLSTKVVLLGERELFYSLLDIDNEFSGLFKVAVDFDDDFERSPENELLVARVIASIAKREQLYPFSVNSVARIVDHAARLADDSNRLTANWRRLADLAREADEHARRQKSSVVEVEHVEGALKSRERRMGRVRERILKQFLDDLVLIDTNGAVVGQVNGLTVIELGDVAYGGPARITARVGMGRGNIVNIEREVDLSGSIHSKGVLTFTGFMLERYGRDVPLSLDASLAFEQSYMPVDGDSASCAELCALLSAIANIKLSQSLAVTGSVNQRGELQVVGGVNEKIEGFYDLCSARGLDGTQGVVIPHTNVRHLMLRPDVVQAVKDGRFSVYACHTVDDVLALLSGVPAGARDEKGYTPGTFNARVVSALDDFAKRMRAYRGMDN